MRKKFKKVGLALILGGLVAATDTPAAKVRSSWAGRASKAARIGASAAVASPWLLRSKAASTSPKGVCSRWARCRRRWFSYGYLHGE